MKNRFLTLVGAGLLAMTLTASSLQAKPFLITDGLPHLTGFVHILWDDEDLALTPKQKGALTLIKKRTMSGAKALGKKIYALEAQVIKGSEEGATTASLKSKVDEIASLRAQATIIHLDCIYDTRKILSAEQLEVLE